MSSLTRSHTSPTLGRRRIAWRGALALLPYAVLLVACGMDPSVDAADSPAHEAPQPAHDHGDAPPGPMSAAMLANAGYQDVEVAETAGYRSSIDTLGCFQNPDKGGMGVHYIDESALDAQVDARHPEALVYELDADGEIAGLVAHEYIVPIDAWTSRTPPRLFGRAFHQHPTLPLWVLHVWLWKPNPEGMFSDWNPAVRMCPAGVPIFGRDLP